MGPVAVITVTSEIRRTIEPRSWAKRSVHQRIQERMRVAFWMALNRAVAEATPKLRDSIVMNNILLAKLKGR